MAEVTSEAPPPYESKLPPPPPYKKEPRKNRVPFDFRTKCKGLSYLACTCTEPFSQCFHQYHNSNGNFGHRHCCGECNNRELSCSCKSCGFPPDRATYYNLSLRDSLEKDPLMKHGRCRRGMWHCKAPCIHTFAIWEQDKETGQWSWYYE